MSFWLWFFVALAFWFLASFVIGHLVGKVCKQADRIELPSFPDDDEIKASLGLEHRGFPLQTKQVNGAARIEPPAPRPNRKVPR